MKNLNLTDEETNVLRLALANLIFDLRDSRPGTRPDRLEEKWNMMLLAAAALQDRLKGS